MSTIRETLEIEGNQIHIAQETDNDWEVWLDTDAGEYDGLCIGIGDSREAAMVNARITLQVAVGALNEALDEGT